jgi:NADPH-ferrihemoprotein reductase
MDAYLVPAGLVLVAGALLAVLIHLRSSSNSISSQTSGTVKKLEEEKKNASTNPVLVVAPLPPPTVEVRFYFGSQTGTSQKLAKQLARDCAARVPGSHGVAIDMEVFSSKKDAAVAESHWKFLSSENKPIAVFLVSTYGEGDPTDNARDFYKAIFDETFMSSKTMTSLQFSVFGLGNTQYEHYNASGRRLNKQLEVVGAKRFYQHGEGDDDDLLEDDFAKWRDGGLWSSISNQIGGGGGSVEGEVGAAAVTSSVTSLEPTWRVVFIPQPSLPLKAKTLSEVEQETAKADRESKHFFSAISVPVLLNDELRPSSGIGNSTRLIDLDLSTSKQVYETADNLLVCPENDPTLVESVARWLGFDINAWFTLESNDSTTPFPFPLPCSVRTALTCYFDLNGKVDRDFIAQLAPLAVKFEDRARLTLLGTGKGNDAKTEFTRWAHDEMRSVAEVFQEFNFNGGKFDLAHFLQLVPKLQPRFYTIASSAKVHPQRVSIVASVIDTVKPGKDTSRRLQGVTSSFFLRKPTSIKVLVRQSSFRLPVSPSTPIIMVGPGTGIAPMRAFLQERRWQREKLEKNAVGETILFFGCRNRSEDYILAKELQEYVDDGTLNKLHVAFSRETSKKVYVQHLISQEGSSLHDLIVDKKANIYVCGATKMGSDVQHAFNEILKKDPSFVKKMQSEHRYIQELWQS